MARLAIIIAIIILAGWLLWDTYSKQSAHKRALNCHGPLSPQERADIHATLESKGKTPWLTRNKGLGVIHLKSGALLPETVDYLDAYEARTSLSIYDEKPLFTDDYDQQEGKANALSRALEQHLQASLAYDFRAIAGKNRVDVVQLADHGNEAYVFVIDKQAGPFIVPLQEYGCFYYDVPGVLESLEAFINAHAELAPVIWLERDSGFFMFVIHHNV